jgi:uncharacterized membrane protein YjgN (DUF898 family)
MQFRLANTSWRGLRFRFTGDLRGAYAAMIPLFLPALCLVASLVFVPDQNKPPSWYIDVTLAVFAAIALLFPWLFQRLKAYQHNHYTLASQHTRFQATVGMFYKIYLMMVGVCVLTIVTLGVVAAVVGALLVVLASDMSNFFAEAFNEESEWLWVAMVAIFPAIMLVFVALVKPYITTRMQNLVWSNTQSEDVRILSKLKARSMLWLSIKNWTLVVFTLGLYWPFAAIARTRMQLEAVGIASHISLDTLVSQGHGTEGEAAGDAAGDLFGLDIGFGCPPC